MILLYNFIQSAIQTEYNRCHERKTKGWGEVAH